MVKVSHPLGIIKVYEARRMLLILFLFLLGLAYVIGVDTTKPIEWGFTIVMTEAKFLFIAQSVVVAVTGFIVLQVYLDEVHRKEGDRIGKGKKVKM